MVWLPRDSVVETAHRITVTVPGCGQNEEVLEFVVLTI